MEMLIWAGALVTGLGLAGLVACIAKVARARAAGLSEEALKARMQSVVALNLAALVVSALGLMMVVVGIFLS